MQKKKNMLKHQLKWLNLHKIYQNIWGVESIKDAYGIGFTSVYWKDEGSINTWRNNTEHKNAKNADRQFGRNNIQFE